MLPLGLPWEHSLVQECWRHVSLHCGGIEEAQAGRETSISKGVVCNKVGSPGEREEDDTEGGTLQHICIRGRGHCPRGCTGRDPFLLSSSPSLPHPHLPYRSTLRVQPHCISVCLRGWLPPWTGRENSTSLVPIKKISITLAQTLALI